MSKHKCYVSVCGDVATVHDKWSDCEAHTSGVSGAIVKGFRDKTSAEQWIAYYTAQRTNPFTHAAYTDGSNFNDTIIAWGLVVVPNGATTPCHQASGLVTNKNNLQYRNEAGELEAAIQAVIWAHQNNAQIRIHHDYVGVSHYVLGIWEPKSTMAREYVEFMNAHKECISGFYWVKGHTNNEYNELADKLAGEEMARHKPTV